MILRRCVCLCCAWARERKQIVRWHALNPKISCSYLVCTIYFICLLNRLIKTDRGTSDWRLSFSLLYCVTPDWLITSIPQRQASNHHQPPATRQHLLAHVKLALRLGITGKWHGLRLNGSNHHSKWISNDK